MEQAKERGSSLHLIDREVIIALFNVPKAVPKSAPWFHLGNSGAIEHNEDHADCYPVLDGAWTHSQAPLGVYKIPPVGVPATNADPDSAIKQCYQASKNMVLPLSKAGKLKVARYGQYSFSDA
jgi:hypothetical protein